MFPSILHTLLPITISVCSPTPNVNISTSAHLLLTLLAPMSFPEGCSPDTILDVDTKIRRGNTRCRTQHKATVFLVCRAVSLL